MEYFLRTPAQYFHVLTMTSFTHGLLHGTPPSQCHLLSATCAPIHKSKISVLVYRVSPITNFCSIVITFYLQFSKFLLPFFEMLPDVASFPVSPLPDVFDEIQIFGRQLLVIRPSHFHSQTLHYVFRLRK